jgi:LPS export ABC transporter protein LptC
MMIISDGVYRINRFKILLSLVIFLICFVVAVFMVVGMKGEGSAPKQGMMGEADVGIGGFSFFQTEKGRVQWEIKARKAEVFGERHTLLLQDIRATFLTPVGFKVHLEGEVGSINTETHDFVLQQETDFLRVTLSNGITILTKRLKWSNSQNEISTEDPVQVYGSGLVMEGKGLIAEFPSQEIRVLHDVQVVMTPYAPVQQ